MMEKSFTCKLNYSKELNVLQFIELNWNANSNKQAHFLKPKSLLKNKYLPYTEELSKYTLDLLQLYWLIISKYGF